MPVSLLIQVPRCRARTRPLPARHPAALRVDHGDDAVEVGRRARLDAVLALLHLHDLLAVRAPVPPEVGGALDDGAEEARAQLLGARVRRDRRRGLGRVGHGGLQQSHGGRWRVMQILVNTSIFYFISACRTQSQLQPSWHFVGQRGGEVRTSDEPLVRSDVAWYSFG